jgi:HSP20 family protein
MANMTRWEPFRELLSMRDTMDRFFGDAFLRTAEGYGLETGLRVDMMQTEDEVIVKASLPGVKPEDIHISVTGDVLTLKGEVREEKTTDQAAYHLRERSYGAFARSLSLPADVVADQAKAEFENGVLTLTLPKAEQHKPKTITVKAR